MRPYLHLVQLQEVGFGATSFRNLLSNTQQLCHLHANLKTNALVICINVIVWDTMIFFESHSRAPMIHTESVSPLLLSAYVMGA